MTYPPHALLRFTGRWYDTEQWSCGLRIITDDNANTVGMWETAAPNLLEPMAGYVAAWFIRAGSKISNKARLDKVSLNSIGSDGNYSDPGNPHDFDYVAASAPTGASLSTSWPQLTVVVSLRTAVARGYGTHGRVYTPAACAAATTGLITAGDAGGMATSFKDLIEDINGEADLALAGFPRVGVVSNMGEPGASRIVTRVLVGNVIDTQRRRRNSLVEAYSEAVVA